MLVVPSCCTLVDKIGDKNILNFRLDPQGNNKHIHTHYKYPRLAKNKHTNNMYVTIFVHISNLPARNQQHCRRYIRFFSIFGRNFVLEPEHFQPGIFLPDESEGKALRIFLWTFKLFPKVQFQFHNWTWSFLRRIFRVLQIKSNKSRKVH